MIIDIVEKIPLLSCVPGCLSGMSIQLWLVCNYFWYRKCIWGSPVHCNTQYAYCVVMDITFLNCSASLLCSCWRTWRRWWGKASWRQSCSCKRPMRRNSWKRCACGFAAIVFYYTFWILYFENDEAHLHYLNESEVGVRIWDLELEEGSS